MNRHQVMRGVAWLLMHGTRAFVAESTTAGASI